MTNITDGLLRAIEIATRVAGDEVGSAFMQAIDAPVGASLLVTSEDSKHVGNGAFIVNVAMRSSAAPGRVGRVAVRVEADGSAQVQRPAGR